MKTDSNTLLMGGLAAVVLVGLGGFVVPQAVRAQRAGVEIEEFRAELERPNVDEKTIATLEARLEAIRGFGEERITPIPDEADLAGLMRDLSAMFAEAGLEAPQLTTGVPDQAEGAKSLPLTVVAEGPFLPIAEMLERIESLPRLVRVQRVRLATEANRRSAEVDRSGIVRADILLDVFFEPSAPNTEGTEP